MNKKYVLCFYALSCVVGIVASEQPLQGPKVVIDADFKPRKFSEQLISLGEQMQDSFFLLNEYVTLLRERIAALSERITIGDNSSNLDANLAQAFPAKTKEEPSYFETISTKQYILGASIACIVASFVAYKYGYLFTQKNIDMTEDEIKEVVESVINDPLILKHNKLNKIFEKLLHNGFRLDNLFIYGERISGLGSITFEVDDIFTVEIDDTRVYVSRL